MSDIEVVPFKVEHALSLRPIMSDRAERGNPITDEMAKIYADKGVGYTVFMFGELAACFGAIMLWPKVWSAWAMVNGGVVSKHKKDTYIVVSKLIRANVKKLGMVRLQAICRSDDPSFSRFAENLGFKREALMRKYGMDGSDYYLYSMIRED